MVSLSILTALALATTAYARPHSTSAVAPGQPHTTSSPGHALASIHPGPGHVSSGIPAKDSPRSKDHASATKAAGEVDLLDGLPKFTINNRDVNDEECSTAVTVTTKLQVTVTITTSDDQAEETNTLSNSYVQAAESLAEQKQVYTTVPVVTTTITTRHHGHQHGAKTSGVVSSGISASVMHASSGVKPSNAASSQRVLTKSADSSLAAVESSSSAIKPVSTETYALLSILSELPSVVAQAPSSAAATTSKSSSTAAATSATVYSSADDKFHLPSFALPTWQTTTQVTTTKAASTTVQSSTPSSTYPSGKGKRGLAYNDASLTSGFASSAEISWAYNWASSTSGLASGLMYIPTLWSNTATFTKNWQSNAQKAISSGSTHLFSFNEPDIGSQANLSPSDAAAAYKTYLSDMFGGGSTKLCAPSITNGGGSTGLSWLLSFMAACPSCQIDCVNIHWYGTAVSDFEQHVKDTIAVANGKEIWITEFALTGSPSASTVQTFLQSAMSFLDSTEQVAGYAYFMTGQGQLVDGSSPSNPVGTTYMG